MLSPKHIVASSPAFALNISITVIVISIVFSQPSSEMPVTEYVVVTSGLTEISPVASPVLHKYEFPPLAVSIAEFPIIIKRLSVSITTLGNSFTKTVTVSVSV